MNNLWKRFHERYPNAKFSKFKTEKFFGKQNIMFVDRAEEIAVFDDDGEEFRPSLYFSKEMKQNLGLTSGFPSALKLNPSPKLAAPAISFHKTAHSLNDVLINHESYVTQTDKFKIKFRDIFCRYYVNALQRQRSKKMAFRTQYESVERRIKLGRVVFNCRMWNIQSNIISRQNG